MQKPPIRRLRARPPKRPGGYTGILASLPHSVKDQEKCSPRVNRASDGFLPSLVMGLRIKAFLDGEKLE
jgi:hypothetical protein